LDDSNDRFLADISRLLPVGASMKLSQSKHPLTLFFSLSRERGRIAAASLCLLVATLLHLVFAYFAGAMVDTTMTTFHIVKNFDAMIPGMTRKTLMISVTITIFIVVVFSCLEFAWFSSLGERAAARLREKVFGNLIELPMSFFQNHRGGELSSHAMADVMLLQEFWIHELRLFLKNILLIIGGLAMMFYLASKLALIALTVLPVVALFSLFLGKKIRRKTTRAADELARSSVVVEEAIRGIAGIKTYTNEVWEKSRYGKALQAYLDAAKGAAWVRGIFISTAILFVLLVMVVLMWIGSGDIATRTITPGEFTSFMMALGFVGTSGGGLAEMVAKLHRVAGASERLVSILSEKPEIVAEQKPKAGPTQPIRGKVEFRDVSFFYESRKEVTVLNHLNISVEPGDSVALVGPSGSGKSTIVSLLFRLYDPSSGGIFIDGKDSREYSLHELRSQMALVPQEVMLIGGSILENIVYGRPGASRERIDQAMHLARVDEFVAALPDGLQTVVGDRGMQLSGGQRQRVAIARAILRDPAILVLDEATSSLDSKNEIAVREALEEVMRDRTTFVIAHRLGTTANIDHTVVLSEGNVVEQGSRERLLEKDGLYRLLWDMGENRHSENG